MAAQAAANVESVHAGQVEIEDDEIGLVCAGDGEGGGAVNGRCHAKTAALEVVAGEFDDFGLVVDDEDEIVH